MRPALPALACLLLLLAPTTLAGPTRVDVRFDGDDAWGEVRIDRVADLDVHVSAQPVKKALRHALGQAPASPDLVVLLEWTQPAVRAQPDFIAAIGLVTEDGAAWSGVYWVDAAGATQRPHSVTIGAEGLLLLLHGNAELLDEDRVPVTYHFLSDGGEHTSIALPAVDVLDARPVDERIVVGGAAVGKAWPGMPDVMLVSVWNLFPEMLVMGVSVLDEEGTLLQDWTAGGCEPETWEAPESEPGCRVLLGLAHEGATLVTWHEDADGMRHEHERHSLSEIDKAPYTFT